MAPLNAEEAKVSAAIRRTLEVLEPNPNATVELRVLKALVNGWPRTMSGYFNNRDCMVAQAMRYNGKAAGVYVTLNEIHPSLLARSANKMRVASDDDLTKDHEVIRRVWFPVDFDPKRCKGISSTDEEREPAFDCLTRCSDWLEEQGWPEPIVADSGNGYHLLYRIDLPNDDASKQLLKDSLASLASRFNSQYVEIDTGTFNASRIWKLYGTLVCKGDNLPERPHRVASLMHVPEVIQ